MKIIKVSTELEMSVHEFPEGTMREQNKVLYGLIGNGCDLVEHVMPKRLYTELKMPSSPVKEPGKCVSMLIDEEGRLKPNKANLIGSYLYEVDKHGCPIVGNILFIGEKMGDDGVEFCGISEENFSLLETELKNMITAMKATVKEMNMNVGPTRLVQPDFYLLVDVDDLQKQVNTLENEVHRMKRVEARRKWRYGRKNY